MNAFKLRVLTTFLSWFGQVRPATRLRLGAILTYIALILARSRIHVVRTNLKLCFPEVTHTVRERWLKQHFRALAQSFIDRGLLWFGSPAAIHDRVKLSGFHHLKALLAQQRPIIMLAPHFIGLDAAATVLSLQLKSAATIYTPQSNPILDQMVCQGRTRFNDVHLVNRRQGIRALIRHLRVGRPIYYLPDMDFGRNNAIFVPFFNIPAATITATAHIARRWQAAVVPILSTWNPDTGQYQVDILTPLVNFPGDDSLEKATEQLNLMIETWIRRCPSQYYWVHKRFKTRPLGEKKLY